MATSLLQVSAPRSGGMAMAARLLQVEGGAGGACTSLCFTAVHSLYGVVFTTKDVKDQLDADPEGEET